MVLIDDERLELERQNEQALRSLRRHIANVFVDMKNNPMLHRVMNDFNYSSFANIIINSEREYGEENLFDIYNEVINERTTDEPYNDLRADPNKSHGNTTITAPDIPRVDVQEKVTFLQQLKNILNI